MENLISKLEITELVHKLFIYTDEKDWNGLKKEVFQSEVLFDMSSLGAGNAAMKSAEEICSMWDEGFQGIDGVHHQAGHYLIRFDATGAAILVQGLALHFKRSALQGTTRIFAGTYNLHAVLTSGDWRLDQFRYNLRFIGGNESLE